MSAAADILKNFNLFVDGRGFAGNAEEVSLPKLTLKTEAFRAGGLDSDVKIDMGTEPMEASFKLFKADGNTLGQFGLAGENAPTIIARGATQDQAGNVRAIVATMRGTVSEIDPGAWQAGTKASTSYKVDVVYYRYELDGRVIHEVDVIGMKRIINGVDQLAAIRSAIGV